MALKVDVGEGIAREEVFVEEVIAKAMVGIEAMVVEATEDPGLVQTNVPEEE